jgi:hypothetical protein
MKNQVIVNDVKNTTSPLLFQPDFIICYERNTMEYLLAILAWLGIFAPGQQITSSQYDQALQSNTAIIQQVMSDSLSSQQAVAAYGESTKIIVIDPLSR